MLTIAHSIHSYPKVTEGWITTQIRHQRRWSQVVWSQYRRDPPPEGLAVRAVPGRPWLSLGESLRHGYYPWRYGGLIRHDRPDVLLAHFADEAYRLLPVSQRWGLPLLVRCYGYDVTSLPRQGRWLARLQRLFALASGFVVEGPAMGHRLIAMGCPPDKVYLIPLGVDHGAIPWTARHDDGVSPIRVLMAASLREKKGHTFAFSALATAIATHPRLEVTVIGDGPLRGPLQGQVAASPLAGRVRWLGSQSHEALLAAMSQHHLFLHPSVTAGDGDSEGGAPLVLLEAQASGLPVISSVHDDIPTVMRPGISGLVAPERDVPALVTALHYLLENPGRWAEMGAEGRLHVTQGFDPDQLGDRLSDLVADVVAKPTPHPERLFQRRT
ncbi:MAG: glycosyltransferase [Candidatus Sericytochromatia bacterium]|nr:glycosyltransferase [Candidatus Sericytochromatia bacterium]